MEERLTSIFSLYFKNSFSLVLCFSFQNAFKQSEIIHIYSWTVLVRSNDTHQIHSCSTDLLSPSDCVPSALSACEANCSRTAAVSPCPPMEMEENYRTETDCKTSLKTKKLKCYCILGWWPRPLNQTSWKTSATMEQSLKYPRKEHPAHRIFPPMTIQLTSSAFCLAW